MLHLKGGDVNCEIKALRSYYCREMLLFRGALASQKRWGRQKQPRSKWNLRRLARNMNLQIY